VVAIVTVPPLAQDGCRPGSTVPAGACTAGERRSDIVQRSDEPQLRITWKSVDRRRHRAVRVASRAALDSSRRGGRSQLIPGSAEHLKRLLKGFERVGGREVGARLSRASVEGARNLAKLTRTLG
jgi:hypothetical protein